MDEAALSNKYGPEFEKMVQMEMEKMMAELYGGGEVRGSSVSYEEPARGPPVKHLEHRSPPRASRWNDDYGYEREAPPAQHWSPPRAAHRDDGHRGHRGHEPESPRSKARVAYADDLFGNHVINGDNRSKEVENANSKWRPSFPEQDREKKFREAQREALEQQKRDDIEFKRQKKEAERERDRKEEAKLARERYELDQEQKGDYSHHSQPKQLAVEDPGVYEQRRGGGGAAVPSVSSPIVSPGKQSRNRLVNDVYGGSIFKNGDDGQGGDSWRPSHGGNSDREKQFRRKQKEELLAQMEEDKKFKEARKAKEKEQEKKELERLERERHELEQEARGDFSHMKNPRRTEEETGRGRDEPSPSAAPARRAAEPDSYVPQQKRSPSKASRQQLVNDVFGGDIFGGKDDGGGWRPSLGEPSQREKRFRDTQKEQLLQQIEESRVLKEKEKAEEKAQDLRDQARMERERQELQHEVRGDFSHLHNPIDRRRVEAESPRVAAHDPPASSRRHEDVHPDSYVPQQKRSPSKASRQQLVNDVFGGNPFGAGDGGDAEDWKPSHQNASKREQHARGVQKEQLLVQMEEDRAIKEKLRLDEERREVKDQERLERQRQELAYEGRGQFGHLIHRKVEPPTHTEGPPRRDAGPDYDYEDGDSDRDYEMAQAQIQAEERARARKHKRSPAKAMRSIQEDEDSDGGQTDWRAAQRERNAAIAAAAAAPAARAPGGRMEKPSRYDELSQISSEGATRAALGYREPPRRGYGARAGPAPDYDMENADHGGGAMSRVRSLEGHSFMQPGAAESGYYVKTPPSLLFKSPNESYEDLSADRQTRAHGGAYGEYGLGYDKARVALTSPDGFLSRFQMKYGVGASADGADDYGRYGGGRRDQKLHFGDAHPNGYGPDLGVAGSASKRAGHAGTIRSESMLVPVDASNVFGEASVLEQSLIGDSQLTYDFMNSVAVSSDAPGGLAGRLAGSRDRLVTPEASVDLAARDSYLSQSAPRSQHQSRGHSAVRSRVASSGQAEDLHPHRSSRPATAEYAAVSYQSKPATPEYPAESYRSSQPATPSERYQSKPATPSERYQSKPATPSERYQSKPATPSERYQSKPASAEPVQSHRSSKPATPDVYQSKPATPADVHRSRPATPKLQPQQSKPATPQLAGSAAGTKPGTPSIVLRSEAGRQALAEAEAIAESVSVRKGRMPDNPYVPAADIHAELGIHLADEGEDDDEDEIMIMSTYPDGAAKSHVNTSATTINVNRPAGAVENDVEVEEEVEEDYGDDYEEEVIES